MSYVALYRTYRPQAFSDVAGQVAIVKTLQNAIKTNKIGHAYLFSGPRGTGKTSLAKIFAKAVNCQSPVEGNPCNKCDICKGITNNTISDVIEIDGASNNGVDEIRELRDKVKYMPSASKYKVYIIDEVHMLTTGAFNALLKTLEEPPSHVIFILATTEVHKIPLTILSRCQRYDFKGIDHDSIVDRVRVVAKLEKVKIDNMALDAIARSAEGGLRDALSLLDQAISYTSSDIKESDINEISGAVSKSELVLLLKLINDKDTSKALLKMNEFIDMGKEEDRIVNDLILTLRDVLLMKVSSNDLKIDRKIVKEISVDKIYYYINILTKTQNDMKYTHQKRVYLELGIIQMIEHKEVLELDLKESLYQLRKEFEVLKNSGISTTTHVKTEKGQPLVKVSDIETTLYEAVSEKKNKMINLMKTFNNVDSHLELVAHSLKNSELVAASINRIILTHDDINIATELMQPCNYRLVLDLFNKEGQEIDRYVVIHKDDWNKVRTKYISLLKTGQKRPKIGEYDFKIYEEIKKNTKKQEPETVRRAKELFGDLVEVKE